jgi:hypothetical protein
MTPSSQARRERRGNRPRGQGRARPADGGIVWREELNAFECYGCGEFEEVHSAARRTPEKLAETKELLIKDHSECWEFDDPRMALDARRFRKEKKRRELLAGRGLAGQRTGWRGR